MANYKLKYTGQKIDELLDKINDLEMDEYYSKVETNELLNGKQDKLTFGSGLLLHESTLSIDDTVVATRAFVGETFATKQDLETIKRNAITLVDTTEYPTLEDFLASTGEEGIVYWYPIDTTDLNKGYHTYVWETSSYIPAGDTVLSLSDYAALAANNTFSGSNTFSGTVTFSDLVDITNIAKNNATYYKFTAWYFTSQRNLDLGASNYPWKNLYMDGKINNTNVSDIEALVTYAKAQGWIE